MPQNTQRAAVFVLDGHYGADLAAGLGRLGIDVTQATQGAFAWENILANTDFASVQAVIAQLPESGDAVAAARLLLRRAAPGTFVLLLGREQSVGFYHQLRKEGASEYFPLTTPAEEIAQCVARSLAPREEKDSRSRILVTLGAGGGAGAGMLTASIASVLASRGPVVCVDARLSAPSVGSYFAADAPGSLPVLLRSMERLDSVLVEQVLQEPKTNLKFVDGYDPFGETPPVTDISRLTEEIGKRCAWQVWRVPPAAPFARSLLEAADVAVPVVTGSMTSLRIAQTLSLLVSGMRAGSRAAWVYSHRDAAATVSPETAARHLGISWTAEIAHMKRVNESLVQPLKWLEEKTPLRAAAEAVVAGGEPASKSGSFWSRVWK